MLARRPDEEHRAATPLELFFDLVFVVAVAQGANSLHHAVANGTAGRAVASYAMVFFAIWWAWMNFTWFASAYDTDDVPYRLAVFVQIAGALVLAAGIPAAFAERDFGVATLGYVIMRVALVGQWLRAAAADPAGRPTALRYALGVALAQAGWATLLLAPDGVVGAGFAFLVAAELAVPVWAERAAPTSWHRSHISERYGLFTIIVLGETILAASLAIEAALTGGAGGGELWSVIAGGLLIVLSMWWLYFDGPELEAAGTSVVAFVWGYGHLAIFGSAAAVGAGLAVAVDHATGHTSIGTGAAGLAVAIPVAIYVGALWVLHELPRPGTTSIAVVPAVVLAVLLTPASGFATLLTGVILACVVASKIARRHRESIVGLTSPDAP
jgi:low temperature requirement protein LtrA